MSGLILKNYFETFRITKNLLEFIFGFGLVGIMVILGTDFYIFCLMTMIIFPLMISSPLQYTMEQNELCKFDDILLTYPLSKKEIVRSHFLSCLLFCGITGILSLLTVFVYVYLHHTTDLKTGLLVWAGGLLLSLAFLAASSIGFFALGNKKGTILYLIFVVLCALSYALTYNGIDFMSIFTLDARLLLLIGLIISLLLLWGSYRLCLRIYTKKHS
jgi:hypothetical protein